MKERKSNSAACPKKTNIIFMSRRYVHYNYQISTIDMYLHSLWNII